MVSAPARIVTGVQPGPQAGAGHRLCRGPRTDKVGDGLAEHGVSKLANLLFSAELVVVSAGTGHHVRAASAWWRPTSGEVPWLLRPLLKLWMISAGGRRADDPPLRNVDAVAGETGLYYDHASRLAQPRRTRRRAGGRTVVATQRGLSPDRGESLTAGHAISRSSSRRPQLLVVAARATRQPKDPPLRCS